jgi:hypothetical protein
MALNAGSLDARRLERAHAQLRDRVARCSRLPGTGTESSAMRGICKGMFRVDGHVIGMQRCSDGAGGGSEAMGLRFLAALPAMNRDFDATARASDTIAAALLSGRCRTAFAAQARTSKAAAESGRKFLASVPSSDPQAVTTGANEWTAAFEQALDPSVGLSDRGCRPLL